MGISSFFPLSFFTTSSTAEVSDKAPEAAVPLIEKKLQQIRNSNLSNAGLIHHADFWFNLRNSTKWKLKVSEAVQWQLLHATRAHKNQSNFVNLGQEFGFEHLQPADIALLYRIIRSYCVHGASSLYGVHAAAIKAHFAFLCFSNPAQAHEIKQTLESFDDQGLADVIQSMNSILQGTPSHKKPVDTDTSTFESYDKSQSASINSLIEENDSPLFLSSDDVATLSQWHPDSIVWSGTTAAVRLYGNIAIKAYHLGETHQEKKNLTTFFDNEVRMLKSVEGMNGSLHLLGIDHQKRTIVMTRIKTESALTLLKKIAIKDEQAIALLNYGSQLVQWLARLHLSTLKIPSGTVVSYKVLEDLNPDFAVLRNYKSDIESIQSEIPYKQQILIRLNSFLEKPATHAYVATCHNDAALLDFYPKEHALLDFNAGSRSPIAREAATLLNHVIFQIQNELPLLRDDQELIKDLCKHLLDRYIQLMRVEVPEFTIDTNSLRLFLSHQILKRSLFFNGLPIQLVWFERILTLLDSEVELTLDELLSIITS